MNPVSIISQWGCFGVKCSKVDAFVPKVIIQISTLGWDSDESSRQWKPWCPKLVLSIYDWWEGESHRGCHSETGHQWHEQLSSRLYIKNSLLKRDSDHRRETSFGPHLRSTKGKRWYLLNCLNSFGALWTPPAELTLANVQTLCGCVHLKVWLTNNITLTVETPSLKAYKRKQPVTFRL